MANKKNKKSKKPAVGKPAAGSNNKRDKNESHNANTNEKNGQQKKSVQSDTFKKDKSIKEPAKIKKSDADKLKKHNTEPKKIIEKQTSEKKNNKFADKLKKIKPDKTENISLKKEKKEKKSDFDFKKLLVSVKEKLSIRNIAIAAVVIAVIAVALVFVLNKNISVPDSVKNAEFKGRIADEPVAFSIDISENQQEALAKATKVKGDKDAFSFFITDHIIMNEYDDPALIEFGSVNSNDCVLVFFILDENGNELYHSLGVEPGKQIKSVEFYNEISYGTHEATVAVLAYDAETYEKIGMQTTKITLEIGVE